MKTRTQVRTPNGCGQVKVGIQTSHPQTGSALAMALVVVTLVAGLGGAFLQLTGSISRTGRHNASATSAFYLAEAGLAEAFQAVRIGRTGQVGSEEAPASFGDGVIWVDASVTKDNQVRLRSTALVGQARATLEWVVEPVSVALGFFSVEDLTVESVLLLDGFDSSESSYDALVEPPTSGWLNPQGGDDDELVLALDYSIIRYAGIYYDVDYESEDGYHYINQVPKAGEFDHPSKARVYFDQQAPGSGQERLNLEPLQLGGELVNHSGGGGLLASNGDIIFDLPDGETGAVFGDLVPGPNGSVQGLEDVQLSGSTNPRPNVVEFPGVEIPTLTMSPPIIHSGLLPMDISPGTQGFESIEISADAELSINGPATIVIGTLILAPGAELTLDTRGGPVDIYVTGGMDLQKDSIVTNSGGDSTDTTIQVAPIASVGSAPISLDATGQFHGTLYAPGTEVYIGSDFEFFGGAVARKLTLGPGAKLHYDSAAYEGSKIPKIISWLLVEIPATVKSEFNSPFEKLGVDANALPDLCDAHNLESVELNLVYTDLNGTQTTFTGPEDEFNWQQVLDVVSLTRVPTRVEEAPGTPAANEEDPKPVDPEPIDPNYDATRQTVADAFASMHGKTLRDALLDAGPMTPDELIRLIDDEPMSAGHTNEVLMGQAAGLSEEVLQRIVNSPSSLGGDLIKDRLVQNSPLSDSIIQLLLNPLNGPLMSDSLLDEVLAAQ